MPRYRRHNVDPLEQYSSDHETEECKQYSFSGGEGGVEGV